MNSVISLMEVSMSILCFANGGAYFGGSSTFRETKRLDFHKFRISERIKIVINNPKQRISWGGVLL